MVRNAKSWVILQREETATDDALVIQGSIRKLYFFIFNVIIVRGFFFFCSNFGTVGENRRMIRDFCVIRVY